MEFRGLNVNFYNFKEMKLLIDSLRAANKKYTYKIIKVISNTQEINY